MSTQNPANAHADGSCAPIAHAATAVTTATETTLIPQNAVISARRYEKVSDRIR